MSRRKWNSSQSNLLHGRTGERRKVTGIGADSEWHQPVLAGLALAHEELFARWIAERSSMKREFERLHFKVDDAVEEATHYKELYARERLRRWRAERKMQAVSTIVGGIQNAMRTAKRRKSGMAVKNVTRKRSLREVCLIAVLVGGPNCLVPAWYRC